MQVKCKGANWCITFKTCIYECSCIAEFLSCVSSTCSNISSASVTPFPNYPKLSKYLDCIPSQLKVYKLLVPTIAEAVIVRSLDLTGSYYTLSVSSLH